VGHHPGRGGGIPHPSARVIEELGVTGR